jgi:hypothetical protein
MMSFARANISDLPASLISVAVELGGGKGFRSIFSILIPCMLF